jgi:probable F420-dependent oxidoreductase
MGQVRPFRFGVFGETARSSGALLDTARRAKDSGYATFLLRDHLIAEPFGHQLAPLTALAAVAGATNTLRVGTLVLSNDYRHPVILAKEIATLDGLSNGRVELGLGAGFSQAEYDQAGMRFDPPGVRVGRLEEAIRVLKGLFAVEPLTFAGKHYSVSHFDSFPKPVQRPYPLILVGAAGKRMLSIAAREADIIGFQTGSTANGVVSNDSSVRLASAVVRRRSDYRLDRRGRRRGRRWDGPRKSGSQLTRRWRETDSNPRSLYRICRPGKMRLPSFRAPGMKPAR